MPSHFFRRLFAAALTVSLLASQAALASDALGWNIAGEKQPVSEGLSYQTQSFWSDSFQDKRAEQILEYTPNENVVPVVSYGDKVLTKSTLTQMARALETDGNRVVGGMNGDFYVVATGAPLGLLVTEGELRSSSSYHYAAGFKSDGSVIIGKPEMTVNVSFLGMTLNVLGGVNKIRNETDGYFLLTPDFHEKSQLVGPGIEVVLRPVADEQGETSMALYIGGTRKTQVVEVRESGNNNPIPSDCYILTVHEQGTDFHKEQLRALQPGDEVTISISCPDAAWNEVDYAVGAMWKLLTGGVVESGLSNERTARTAIGLRPDGTAVFYTIDGKQTGHSIGANLTQVAQRLLELGCTEAIALDGGGSTTFGTALPYESVFNLKNSPSDGAERRNTNAIFFVSKLPQDGILSGISVHPGSNFMLAGANTTLSVRGYDGGFYSTAVTGESAYFASEGSVNGDVFTAPLTSADVTVTAQHQGFSASAEITVVQHPDEIRLYHQQEDARLLTINVEPGEVLDITANALKYQTFLTSQDTCYTWRVEGDCASVDANGVLTAGAHSGSGKLIVSAGNASVTMDIHVVGRVELIDGMESAREMIPFGMNVTQERDGTQIRFGDGSLRLEYNLASGTADARAQTPWNLSAQSFKQVRYGSVWVYGDASGNVLSVLGNDGITCELATLDFAGWKQILFEKPADMTQLTGFSLSGTGKGAIWIDQLTVASEAIYDEAAPLLHLELVDGVLKGVVADNVDKEFAKDSLRLTLDGEALAFTWNQAEGTLRATLPESTRPLRRVRLEARDASGNIGSIGLDVQHTPEPIVNEDGSTTEAEHPVIFVDTQEHWAKDYAEYLYYEGISTGASGEDGLYYYPNREITRQEFFTLAARFTGDDLGAYAEVELPFADLDAIADWALPSVKKMYALGYLKGSAANGAVYANPNQPLSRAEAMTMLGRMQSRGYALADLSVFTDASAVAAWAQPYVQSLVAQEVISGYNGYIHAGNNISRGEVAKMLTYLK